MNVGDSLNSEDALLGTFLIVALYMFAGSFGFERAAAIFPRYTAGAVIVGAGLLLIGKHTSGQLSELREMSVDVYDDQTDEFETEYGNESDETAGTTERGSEYRSVGYTDRISSELFTVLSVCGYVGLSFLIGMLWASPIFVAAYTTYLGLAYRYRIALSIAGFLIAFVFMVVINAPLDEGIVTLVDIA